MRIDYSSLPDEYKGLSHDEAKRANDQLNRKLQDLHNHLVKIQAPNMKVSRLFYMKQLGGNVMKFVAFIGYTKIGKCKGETSRNQ